ncbi:hypothetical protein [Algicella marina]|uniref:Uncharacterized protein n=1 Tax=Algicella marina TaxID=2683284 RepID=A0A6P1T6I9_9RHOB|nr:hypothetical protein [Algicella marina]QHQ36182.1 hypothetical protein GO499_13880 [Algicella marina]
MKFLSHLIALIFGLFCFLPISLLGAAGSGLVAPLRGARRIQPEGLINEMNVAIATAIFGLCILLPVTRRRLIGYPRNGLVWLLQLVLLGTISAIASIIVFMYVVAFASAEIARNPAVTYSLGFGWFAFFLAFCAPGFGRKHISLAGGAATNDSHREAQRPQSLQSRREALSPMHRLVLDSAFGIVLGACFIALFGVAYTSFIPRADVNALLSSNAILIALPFGGLFWILGLADPNNRTPLSKVAKGALGAAFVMSIVVLSLKTGFLIGTGALHAMATEGPTETLETRVVRKGQEYRRTGCDRSIRIEVPEIGTGQVCRLPSSLWARIEPGDRITVTGERTALGFAVEYVSPR